MTFVQATSGGGGWPMSVFLTPDLKPFYGATYFPPEDKYGMPGFTTILKKVSSLWQSRKQELMNQGNEVMEQLATAVAPSAPNLEDVGSLVLTAMDGCAAHLEGTFDSALGGFGGAPKFPRPCELNLLVRQYLRKKGLDDSSAAKDLLHMIQYTLERMSSGGIYDHIGGGFHRYSVDEHWHVPHFEKMLYDNPQIALTYINAFQLTGEHQWAEVVRGILDYLRRDMTHPDGGLYSAEDADSLDTTTSKKAEGAFYVWTSDEIESVLDPADAKAFSSRYYVKKEGNCDLSRRSDPHKEFVGKNCLIATQSIAQMAEENQLSESDAEQLLARCRKMLHAAREKRPRPHLDDKVVAAWNGMAIAAFALAGRVLKSESPMARECFPVDGVEPSVYMSAAVKVAEFVLGHLWDDSTGSLRRSFCKGPSDVSGFADDYAWTVTGLLDLYETSGEIRWLQWAVRVQSRMNELFWDGTSGGYYSTSGKDPSILLRAKEDYDGAEPSASSIAASNLLRLGALLGSEEYKAMGVKTISAYEERLSKLSFALPQMCASAYLLHRWPLRQVVIVGTRDSPETQTLMDAIHAPLVPDKVVITIDPADPECLEFWNEKNPDAVIVASDLLNQGANCKPTVFVCQNFTCQAPTSDPQAVKELLARPKSNGKVQVVDLGALGLAGKE